MRKVNGGASLIEVLVAMALVAISASALMGLQMRVLFTVEQALHDAQSLGLMIEALESTAMGATQFSSDLQTRLDAINPHQQRQLSASHSQAVLTITSNHDGLGPRQWRLPDPP